MNKRLALQHLCWKELRQLAPIVTLLPILVVLFSVFQWITRGGDPHPMFSSVTLVLCLGMPVLFACGAGALLVGYEKELRTLGWLSSLPIPAHWIVRVKVLAALACLLVLWVVGFAIFAVDSDWRGRPITEDTLAEWTLLLNSLFVLVAGFALAWWVRSALIALLLVVPVAILPFVLAYGIDNWIWETTGEPNPTTGTLLMCQVVGIGLAWWLAERLGRRALAPRSTSPTRAAWLPVSTRNGIGVRRTAYAKIQSPIRALLWQFVRQCRAVLWGTSIMLAVATLVLATTQSTGSHEGRLIFALLLAFLATTWLGVTTFQSDALGGRIRFLSSRGISPRAIWITRQAVPLSLLALFALLLVVISVFANEAGWQHLDEAGLSVGMYSLAAVLIYLSSQWLGQVVFSPIVSAVAAPPVALAAISYGSFSVEMLATPWWLALLILPIPAVATLAMTRRWMDCRLGFSYWASHAGFLAAICLLPAVPLFFAVFRQPAMPARTAQEIQKVIEESGAFLVGTHELVLSNRERQKRPEETMVASWDREFDEIEDQLQATDKPIGASSVRVIEFLRSTATLLRLPRNSAHALAAEPAQPAEPTDRINDPTEAQEPLRQYRRAIDLLVQITKRMRLSPRLVDQDTADLIEIWLLAELRRDQAREDLGQALYETTARMLGDRGARRQARIRAVALSWQEFQTATHQTMPGSLGGYQPDIPEEDLGTLKEYWIGQRRVGMAVADLWELARGGSEAATPERLSRIAEFSDHSTERYGLGPHGPFLRADDMDRFLHPPLIRTQPIASQWYADWERLAAELSLN